MPRHPRVEELLAGENGHAPQKSEAWLAARRGLLTASDVPAVLGQSSFCSPAAVMLRKLGIGAKFEGNEATRHGEAYEDEAIERYAAERGGIRVHHGFGLIPHQSLGHMFAGSPDGITDEGVLLEVKVGRSKFKPRGETRGARSWWRRRPWACTWGRWACRGGWGSTTRTRSARGSAGSRWCPRARPASR